MQRNHHLLITDLRTLIADLGRDGGLISPSIYDTAQVIRLAPHSESTAPAVEWLLSCQHADGGWGSPGMPLARTVPTLAATLALIARGGRQARPELISAALTCLWREAEHWAAPLPDDLPVGVELLLPRLLDEAAAMGVALPTEPYAAVRRLGARRRAMLAQMRLRPGTTPVHSWEAYGRSPDPAVLDTIGSVGNSPAATATWLRAAAGCEALAEQRAMAAEYLRCAARATGTGIPGVVPTAWPIDRFEQAYVLHTLLVADMLDVPELQDVVRPKVAELARSITPGGLGFSDSFTADGDDTAAAIAVLHATGLPVSLASLRGFAHGDSFATYQGELQPSLITTTRAVQALSVAGCNPEPGRRYIVSQQRPDGRWPRDKWNSSWMYTTYQALVALGPSHNPPAVARALDGLLAHQRADGSWSSVEGARQEETAYGVLICRLAEGFGLGGRRVYAARWAAEQWLSEQYRPLGTRADRCWLAKENYSPVRVSRALELTALLCLVERTV